MSESRTSKIEEIEWAWNNDSYNIRHKGVYVLGLKRVGMQFQIEREDQTKWTVFASELEIVPCHVTAKEEAEKI